MDQQQLDHILELHREWWYTQGQPMRRSEPIVEPRGQRADLSGLDLSGLFLGEALLTQAELRGTIFRGCELSQALMFGADLRGADLRGAKFCRLFVHDADLRGAQIDTPTDEYTSMLRFELPFDESGEPLRAMIDERIFCQLSIAWARNDWCLEPLTDLTVLPIT
jgi:hypothetical protein